MKHGQKTSKYISGSYKTWRAMKQRCDNPNNKDYHNYGGRGIGYEDRWYSFENFYLDMGARPKGYTLERIDNDKGYSKSNCKWASIKDQNKNKRCTTKINYNGKLLTLPELSEITGISKSTLRGRIKKGLSLFEKHTGAANKKPVLRSDGTVFDSVSSAAASVSVGISTVSAAIKSESKCQGYYFSFLVRS